MNKLSISIVLNVVFSIMIIGLWFSNKANSENYYNNTRKFQNKIQILEGENIVLKENIESEKQYRDSIEEINVQKTQKVDEYESQIFKLRKDIYMLNKSYTNLNANEVQQLMLKLYEEANIYNNSNN